LSASYQDGRIKAFVTMLALRHRRDHPHLFLDGAYLPLESHGAKKDHLCAFAREHDGSEVIVIVPRLIAGLLSQGAAEPIGPDVWQDTHVTLPQHGGSARHYRNVLTGDIISIADLGTGPGLRIADVLKDCPLALLENTA
jgi:(1->4)-alpha-D-glucan 1-alpha-D-glucosylmutase